MSLNWLPLTEYSSKHKVSISTLRRRIKAKDIKYQLKEGRYLIADEPVTETGAFQGNKAEQKHRPSLKETRTEIVTVSASTSSPSPKLDSLIGTSANSDEPILTAANRLLSELKKAYTQILQEKEEQILHLKEEVADLKTLVRVLESENQRLQR
jgi:hypothetical protein